MKKIILIILLIFIFPQNVSAKENILDIEKQIEMHDFSLLQNEISKTQYGGGLSVTDILKRAINGQLDLSASNIITIGLKALFKEIYDNSVLIKNLLVVAILSAVLNNLTTSFKRSAVAELGFYISYIVLIIILFDSFKISIGIMTSVVSDISNIMTAMIPLIMGLLFVSGNSVSALVFNPSLYFAVNIITKFINEILAPILTIVAVIQTINYLSVKDIFTKFNTHIRGGITFVLKTISVIFITILSLQRISAPIANNFITKTAKTSVRVIPVVGDVLSGAIDTVIFWTSATKNGLMVAAVIIIIIISALPVIKLGAFVLIYKATASIIQPICDERIVECINEMGSLTAIILGATFMVLVMFIFNIMITLSI